MQNGNGENKLQVYSIFSSIAGEVNSDHQGVPMTFVRLAGCNLCCDYCDVPEARLSSNGKLMTVEEVVKKVKQFSIPRVMITGGEPLLQMPSFNTLIQQLFDKEFKIFVETNGTIRIPNFSRTFVESWIIDWKIPLNTTWIENTIITEQNIKEASFKDFLKFVIRNREDYEIAGSVIRQYAWHTKLKFAVSPVHGQCSGRDLISWLLEDGLVGVIVNIQIHKYLGLEEDTKGGELKKLGG